MAGKRELINTGTDKRYVRDIKANSTSPMMWGRSLRQDVKRKAKTVVKAGHTAPKVIKSGSK